MGSPVSAAPTSRVCLIVDNPLRDLDGAVLLAWQLAQRGAECHLVPMYTQGFDVLALRPDVVVANYVRRNNIDLLRQYKRAGMRVAVLDTEGAISRSAEHYARMVAISGCREFVDLYCVWGEAQRNAFVEHRVMPGERVRVAGCPRYDYCAPQWRSALAASGESPGFVLINTNFPVVNPRFASGTRGELRVWKRVGVDAAWAERFAADSQSAFAAMLETCQRLADDFPDRRFVLRPHPFESLEAYQSLERHANFVVRQSGAVLGWLNDAALLVHQNCSTAIEAIMLEKEPLSLEWFNTPALHMPSPTRVSHPVLRYEDLRRAVEQAAAGEPPLPADEILGARSAILSEEYASADGRASERTAEMLLALCAERPLSVGAGVRVSLRGRIVSTLRGALGYRGFRRIRGALRPGSGAQFAAKSFSQAQVEDVLRRIESAVRPEVRTDYRKTVRARGGEDVSPSGYAVRVCVERLRSR